MESYIDLVLEMTATFDNEGFQLPSKVTRSEVLKALHHQESGITSQLKLERLKELLPSIDSSVIQTTFFLNGCSSDATEAALREVYNLPLTRKQTPTTVDEEIEMVAVAADAEEDTASRRQSQRGGRAEDWTLVSSKRKVAVARETLNDRYCAVLASFRRGQHILAVDRVRELSQARREHREAQRQWAHEFFLAHEEHLKHQRPIDLHGMIVMEAMWVAREAIEYCQAHRIRRCLLICGVGHHSINGEEKIDLPISQRHSHANEAQASVASAWASRNLFHFGDGTQPRGVIRVAHIDDNDRSNRIGFKVFGACGKVIDIRAHDNQERNRWLRALKTPARRKSRSWSIGSSEEVTVSMSSFDPDGLCRFDRLSIPITKSGWMEKKTSFLGIWRRYFFVVQGSMLSYYTSDKPYEVPVWRGYVEGVKARRRSGSLILPSASGSVTPPPLELFITLDSPQHQVLRVRLGSMEEAREWRRVLRGNMLQNNDTAYMF
ncbi:hypothetical protein BBO99_00006579 [Phytophthora kernoviae]|uniref:Uncharacterized protein n=1 Tax=Phytophthora kernoviae TaxID=325452 RepID=A0A3R7J5E4_9STRA|nr:hypothetical protein BBI17_006603 [Phytophthora kernoviae]RLN77666.1 hypothetical protein BBO99_00006579 [Phytophthora kernoviae]